MRVTEKNKPTPRWESPDIIQEASLFPSPFRVIAADDNVAPSGLVGHGKLMLAYGTPGQENSVVTVQYDPFAIVQYVDGVEVMRANDRNMLHFEQHRSRDGTASGAAAAAAVEGGDAGSAEDKEIVDYGEDGLAVYADGTREQRSSGTAAAAAADSSDMWEETFQTHKDSKPLGPASVGLDLLFPATAHVFGIPEHATSFSLKPTRSSSSTPAHYSEPYRLYNLDVFEYELDEPMALYGSIPVLLAPRSSPAPCSGLFWNNPSETFVDIEKGEAGTHTHWISESGVLDVWVLSGASPATVNGQYAAITGAPQLPPLWALGYHQCRWNYKDEQDVAMVDAGFDEMNMPYDVLWLDIEHTDGKRYFTWDKDLFPTPASMQDSLAERRRNMVTIVDPHIKRDPAYAVHTEATDKGLYIKAPPSSGSSEKDFDGWCWPGSSSYLDFTCPEVREWWASRFSLEHYAGSTHALYTWNDMNEPSVFNGPEVSMPKDARSRAGVEHREWHNMYGFYMQWATQQGQLLRQPEQDKQLRPFVLSRAFSAGSQRFGAIWTGDNMAQWEHLQVSGPMLLSVSIAGLPFAGADVGGFFGNPDTELLTRWYQAGAYQPFFRGHAHHDSHRREPWLFGEEVTRRVRGVLRQRYALLPFWYTLFAEATRTGSPVMRPLWFHHADEPACFGLDDQWLLGRDLLVKPVVRPGETSVSVYLPGKQPWYDVLSGASVARAGAGSMLWRNDAEASQRATVQAPLDVVPVFQRGGSILPRQARARRSSLSMRADPYTLTVALSLQQEASGELYLDDFSSLQHARQNKFVRKLFRFVPATAAAAAADERLAAAVEADGSQQQQQQQQEELLGPGQHATLSSVSAEDPAGFAASVRNTVERVVVLGLRSPPARMTALDEGGERELTFIFDAANAQLTVRKPDVRVAGDWTIRFNF